MSDDASAGLADEADIRLAISPVPTDEELAAIVGAITSLQNTTSLASIDKMNGKPGESAPPRWAMAGRREAMRGIDREDDR